LSPGWKRAIFSPGRPSCTRTDAPEGQIWIYRYDPDGCRLPGRKGPAREGTGLPSKGLPEEASPSPLDVGSLAAVPGAWFWAGPPPAGPAADEPIVVPGPRDGLPDGPGCDGLGDWYSQAGPPEGDRYRFTALGIESEAAHQDHPARWSDPPPRHWLGPERLASPGGDVTLYRYVYPQPPHPSDPAGLGGAPDRPNS
jgi:hypothetical protein